MALNNKTNINPSEVEFNKDAIPSAKDLPIHTMKEDLENINNPDYAEKIPSPVSQDPAIKFFQPQNDSHKNNQQRTSPFLSQETGKITPPANLPTQIRVATSGQLSEKPAPPASNWTRVIVIAIIIFAVLAAGGYGYYFWITRQNSPEIQTPAIQTPSASPSEVPLLSTDKPNYLNIDLENTDSAQIKEMLIKNAQDVSMLQANTLVEFIAVDQQNNPLNFQGFAQKAGINLPAEILAGLGTNFSVFVYNDNGKARLGIAIDSKDITEKTLQKNLLAKEPLLPKILEPLYLPTEYTIEDKTFATSYYGGAEIRYFNITSPEELSVDYTIFRNKLLIGTNKMTLRSMIDYLTAHSTIKGAEDSAETDVNISK